VSAVPQVYLNSVLFFRIFSKCPDIISCFIVFSGQERRPSEVAKYNPERYQYHTGVKSSAALILECRPWLVRAFYIYVYKSGYEWCFVSSYNIYEKCSFTRKLIIYYHTLAR